MKAINQALIIMTAFLGGFTAHFIMDQSPTESFHLSKIIDGDSFEIDNIWQTQIRLNAIDTPEKNKPFFTEATATLKAFCLDKPIILRNKGDGEPFTRFKIKPAKIAAEYGQKTLPKSMTPKTYMAGLMIERWSHLPIMKPAISHSPLIN